MKTRISSIRARRCYSWKKMDVDIDDFIVVYLELKKRNATKKKKKQWIHPLMEERPTKGIFNSYFADVRKQPDRFFQYTRMSIASFDYLLEKLTNAIQGMDTPMRLAITPEEKLVITLR